MKQQDNHQRLYLACQILGWFAHGLISFVFASFSLKMTVPFVVSLVIIESAAAYSSHLLRAWILRHGWLTLPLRQTVVRVFLGSLSCGAAVTALGSFTSVAIFHFDRLPSWNWLNVIPIFFQWSIVIFLWAVIYFAVHYFQGYQNARLEQLRLAVAAKDSELRTLLNQLNPHFIFNCLNSLRGLILENPARAQSMVDELSSVLRYSLRSGRADTVPLHEELEAVQAYLKIERIRFEERLQVSMQIDPASLSTHIPPMLLQTLVENGIKHGISRRAQGGEIRIASKLDRQTLKLEVTNTGQIFPAVAGVTHIGIENARERLRLLYGSAASLSLRNLDAQSVFAEVLLPTTQLLRAEGVTT